MQKIILSSPFLAGEELVCQLLSRLTGLAPLHLEHRELVAKLSDGDWFAESKFIAGHFTPAGTLGSWISSEGLRPVFLVRNVFDLLIDQYRYFAGETSGLDNRHFADLPANEGIALIITGGSPSKPSPPGLGSWDHQMQKMLLFANNYHSCILSYEKLLHDPAGQIMRLSDFLGVELTTDLFNELMMDLSRAIDEKTGGSFETTVNFRYSLSCKFTGALTDFHFSLIKDLLEIQAPDLGALSAALDFPEVTAKPTELLQLRLGRIFVATVFKSGTKLLEHIIMKLTGLAVNTPTMDAGFDYESIEPITFESGTFFIWHNAASEAVKARIRTENARPIFLIRNIYDLLVSQYFHFANDVDAEIGHSTNTAEYFAEMERDEGISLLLCGATSKYFTWCGFGFHLRQIQEFLKFSQEYPCHVIIYDRLIRKKSHEIERLASFLGTEISPKTLKDILKSSSLGAMRNARAAIAGSGKHFRKGVPGDHVHVLKPQHYHMINQIKLTHAPELDALCDKFGFGDVTTVPPKATMIRNKVSSSNPSA